MPSYRIGKLKGRFVINVYSDAGERTHRYRLNSTDKSGAEREAPGVFATLTRPSGTHVGDLWAAYEREYEGRAILETMEHTQKALKSRFWHHTAETITVEDCKAHINERRKAGISYWTIYTELSHLRNVFGFAAKHKLIVKAPYIKRPPQPKPKEDKHLTREEVRQLISGAELPHARLSVILFYTTAARSAALRGLKWTRCNFDREQIDLRDPDITRPHKGRAIVAMNRVCKAALLEARAGALSDYVIEWAGEPVKSLKRSLKTAARNAGITKTVSPHVLRHSAAVHMAEDGVDIEVIQQFLGHEDIETTRKIYARFSPTYLKRAAKALEIDDLGSMNQRTLPNSDDQPLISSENLVGATGIEPVTPTMSRLCACGVSCCDIG
jgi:site-specific recombinase XerD